MEEPLVALGQAMARFTEMVQACEGDEPVPACPGWTTADLIAHVGQIHRWCGAILLTGQKQGDPRVIPTEPLDEWYAGNAAALLGVMSAVDPDEPTWNFAHIDEVAAFWPRRQLHEVTVHAVDLAQALGRPDYAWDVDPDVAADGIAEVIRVHFRRMTHRGQRPRVDAPLELVARDVDRSWTVVPGDSPEDPPVLTAQSMKVDGLACGSASDLYLALWGRVPAGRLELVGTAGQLFDGPRTP